MLESLLSLLSILLGVISANAAGFFMEKKVITSPNSIAGVFGSVFVIKSFSRFGFSPEDIIQGRNFNYFPFLINVTLSLVAGSITAIVLHKLKNKIRKREKKNLHSLSKNESK